MRRDYRKAACFIQEPLAESVQKPKSVLAGKNINALKIMVFKLFYSNLL